MRLRFEQRMLANGAAKHASYVAERDHDCVIHPAAPSPLLLIAYAGSGPRIGGPFCSEMNPMNELQKACAEDFRRRIEGMRHANELMKRKNIGVHAHSEDVTSAAIAINDAYIAELQAIIEKPN